MFSTKARLKERQGKYGTPRAKYLQDLVTRFQGLPDGASSLDEKERILARLANFAYDPINYEYLRKLNVMELLVDCIAEEGAEEGAGHEKLVELAMGGLCNAAADPANAAAILGVEDAIFFITAGLSSPVTNTVLSSMTCLYYLCNPGTKSLVLTPEVRKTLQKYADSPFPRFRNLAQAFFQKHG